MLQLTKITHFETAHAVDGYSGPCRSIHGHSYELHVTVATKHVGSDEYIAAPGFVLDFKDLKRIIQKNVTEYFDHKLILSKNFLAKHPGIEAHENLVPWDQEPTAENMLIYISRELKLALPQEVELARLKLFETTDSYAEWVGQV